MYLLFRYHSIMPNDYFNRKAGEKKIIAAFMHHEIDDRNKEADEINTM